MHNIMDRYNEIKKELLEFSKEIPNKLGLGLMSAILAALIMMGPIVLLINCFIFNDYLFLIIIGLFVCLYFIILLGRIFYYQSIAKKRVQGMHIFYLVDGFVYFLVVLACFFIFLFI
ncbi:MAG: hypothetical protein K2P14_02180 [Anaeroplasmataceae bacterium]|nr:hypothetical protein [Anaeroplasmataceae bacterium]